MSDNQDLRFWWMGGAQKKVPSYKPTNSEPSINSSNIKIEGKDTKIDNPVSSILKENFGHHSFLEYCFALVLSDSKE